MDFQLSLKISQPLPIPDIKPGGILASVLEKVPGGKRILGFRSSFY